MMFKEKVSGVGAPVMDAVWMTGVGSHLRISGSIPDASTHLIL